MQYVRVSYTFRTENEEDFYKVKDFFSTPQTWLFESLSDGLGLKDRILMAEYKAEKLEEDGLDTHTE